MVTYKRLLLFSLALIVLALFVAQRFYLSELNKALILPEQGITIGISQGDSLNRVLSQLQTIGVFGATETSRWVARLYAKEKQLANEIKVGEFHLPYGLTIPELFVLITSNRQVRYSITFIEGSTFIQAVQQLSDHPQIRQTLTGLSDAERLTLITADSRQSLLMVSDHPEGLLYPDTYYFQKQDSDLSVLKRAHRRLLDILTAEWAQKQADLPLQSPYEALILASIVEKETGVPDERGEIAGVFVRRLIKGMRLQTDPTVIYGLGERYQGNIKRKHLKEHTPYNTYRINGLPPTPISLVGRAAIHAVLHPLAGTSLYFVAKGDGTHHFSASIEEHNRAVRKYQLKRKTDYRSSVQTSNHQVKREGAN